MGFSTILSYLIYTANITDDLNKLGERFWSTSNLSEPDDIYSWRNSLESSKAGSFHIRLPLPTAHSRNEGPFYSLVNQLNCGV